MTAQSPSASTTGVILHACGSIGATLLLVLILIATIRPGMIDMSATMHRLAAAC